MPAVNALNLMSLHTDAEAHLCLHCLPMRQVLKLYELAYVLVLPNGLLPQQSTSNDSNLYMGESSKFPKS